ncbi:sialomucin core protein 24-like isoform X1 [Epinephelus fuscoguttatus]|uniref:sialomucin core protein 24-like isoform X1 n=1 Tax=Epinephelus fuscoguttatus TaxID=293821 RepID=UPI0020D16F9E|nr:sialomucin core protein 24-like isoform X1 [Epinephelus fuscoguttatus]XP_049435039.1 sialomucin core protein 24-like isoform X1 [Epinephelus fuscoguttatus]
MATIFATLACYLLALSFVAAQTNLTVTPTLTTTGLNLTHTMVTSSNSTVHVTVISNVTENTTPLTNTTQDNGTFTTTTAAATASTSHLQTSQPTTIMTPLTNSTSQMTTTAGTPTSTALTVPTIQTTAGYISTPDTTVITTANSSHTVNTTSDSTYKTTEGLGLNMSDKNMTILFSVVLGVFALALVGFMFHRCKHKIQYFHQPLHNTDDTADTFEADDDTLVISGGLYDGHPIYDNVPPDPPDQSQFRLEFLH